MPITKNPTVWRPKGGEGYVTVPGSTDVLTQSGVSLLTQSGEALLTQGEQYNPKNISTWAKTTKNVSSWRPKGGEGYVVVQGTLNLTDNRGNFITDNLGNFLVTTPTYTTGKNPTTWTASGL